MSEMTVESFKLAQDRVKEAFVAADVPDNYWITISGWQTATDTLISSSVGGTLWVFFEYGGSEPPALTLTIDGQSVDVPLGQSTYDVTPYFILTYDVSSVPGSSVKLGYSIS